MAAGHEDVYLHSSLIKKWDLCAGAAILNTLGGRLTDTDGKDLDFKNEYEFRSVNKVTRTPPRLSIFNYPH